MKMNFKKWSVATMSLSYLLLAPLSYASNTEYDDNYKSGADGQVTINGEVIAQTCKVVTGGKNITVTLDKVGAESLNIAGKVAAARSFTISLDSCTAVDPSSPNKTVGIYFEPNPTQVDAKTGTLMNIADTNKAENVNVQLLDEQGTAINLTNGTNKSDGKQKIRYQSISDQTLNFNFQAQYYATGKAKVGATTTGNVKAVVPFSIVYE